MRTHLLSLLLLLGATPLASADTRLTAVSNYQRSGDAAAWAAPSPWPLPEGLVTTLDVPTPSRAYSAPYPNVFLQNERVVVCDVSCDGPQLLTPTREGERFVVELAPGGKKGERALKEAQLRQTTVYYWVNAVLERFEALGYTPSRRLTVLVDREITDPETGDQLTNNAFFLSTKLNYLSWSLSFLPAERSLGVNLLPSGFDPSVAMHEATHFVFQELVGDILNPEIYGLHEAFADYFSMALLGSPDIGQVMMKGKALRSAREILPYKPNMEAHDLGNVVVSGLWNVRELFSDKMLADKIALETIREVSRHPFAAAGEVVPAWRAALATHGQAALVASPDLAARADAIWAQTGLTVPEILPNLEAVKGVPVTAEESAAFVTASFVVKAPDSGVLEFGLPPLRKATLSLVTTRPGPPGDNINWLLVGLQDLEAPRPSATPIWVLYSTQTGIVRMATSLDGTPITQESGGMEDYRNLLRVGEDLNQLLAYTQDFGAEFTALLDGRRWATYKSRGRSTSTSWLRYGFGDTYIPMTVHEIRVRPSFVGRIAGVIAGSGATSITAIRLYTVDAAHLKSPRLPRSASGEVLVGYELTRKTGFSMSVRLEELGGASLPTP